MVDRDRLSDIERRTQELEDATARLPVTWPTSTPGNPVDVILGQTTAAVTTSNPTFTIDNIVVVQGTDPRPSPVGPTQTITVKNTFALDIDDNTLVRAEKNKDDEWESIRPGEGSDPGPAGASTVPFRYDEDKAHNVPDVQGTLLDQAGNPKQHPFDETTATEATRLAMTEGAGVGEVSVGEVVKQMDTNHLWTYDGGGTSNPANWTDSGSADFRVRLVDKRVEAGNRTPAGRWGRTDYTGGDNSTQLPYLGQCKDMGVADYGGTGLPGYEIISQDGPAAGVWCKLLEDAPTSGGSGEYFVEAEILQVSGSNESNRVPEQFDINQGTPPDTQGWGFFDDQDYTLGMEEDDVIYVAREPFSNKYRPLNGIDAGVVFEILIPPVP